MTTQESLPLFEDMLDALAAVVHELGGYKKIGCLLRPELSTKPEGASQWMRDCLNKEKRERLNPEQVMLLLRLAREAGYHAAKHWIDSELGYEQGSPLNPQDQLADLQRRFIESVHLQRQIADHIERLTHAPIKVVR